LFSFKSDGVAPVSAPRKSHGGYVPMRLNKTGKSIYKHMPLVGTLPGSEFKSSINCNRRQSRYAKLYGKVGLQALTELAGKEFFVVNPTEANYYKSVSSWDVKPEYTFEKTESHSFGLEFFGHYYGPIMKDCIAASEEICGYIDWTKSPGWSHTYFGFRTKADLVQCIADTMFFDRTKTLPVYNVSGKIEFKLLSDIEENKIRLFQIPCFELLYSQLKFGKRISLRLMNKFWSAYGFNPYAGGFERLARSLLSKPWRGCYDVSGWDKFLPLLKDIYQTLLDKGEIPPEEMDEFLWMCEHTTSFLLKLRNGNVIHKKYGNASGSGVTTRDNIFGHIIIFAAGLYKAYKAKHGKAPPFSLVHDQLVYLYGDDNVFSLDDEFSFLCDEKFLGEHLGCYGLKLKFFFGGLNADLHTLSFLGASFKKFQGHWYPQYDVKRLATTMVYEKDRLSLSQHLSKAFTLMIMSRPSEEFSHFYDAYSNLVNSDVVQNELVDPTIRAYAFVGVPEKHQIDAFYTGQESSNLDDLMLDFSSDLFDLY
jgi:hypothetical protein